MKKSRWGFILGLITFLALLTGIAIAGLSKLAESMPQESAENMPAVSEAAAIEPTDAVSEKDTEAEKASESVSENTIKENMSTVFGDNVEANEGVVSENAVSENSVSENSVSENSVTVSENAVTNIVSENAASTVAEKIAANEMSQTELTDRQAPWILDVNTTPQVKVGDTFDVHKYMGYADDVDRSVDLQIEGEVDTAVVGEYPIQITLRDDAGHINSQKMTVQVVEEISGGNSNHRTEAFADFISRYKTEETLVGIDVSRWQEDIDFEQVKAAGCEFVYMRIGGYDDGELYTDRYYRYNIEAAKAAGLKIGIYWHAEDSTEAEVRASAAYLLKILDGEEIDYPIAYDWEDFRHFENYGMNLWDLNRNLDVFVEEIEKAGYRACLYNSKYYLENIWTNEANHPIWMANYTGTTTYQGEYFLWQHSNTGRIDGIKGDVDLDVLYLDKITEIMEGTAQHGRKGMR